MKNKIYNLIASLASLVLGVILLVFVCLAWYTNNTKVEANGVNGITGEGAFYDITLRRYLVASETIVEGQPTTYTKGSQLAANYEEAIRYDQLGGYTKIIYEISFKTTLNGFSLSLTHSPGRTNTFVKENSKYYNYLSNVALFSKLEVSGSNLIAKDTTKYQCTSDVINIYNQETSETVNTLYLLFDYNKDSIIQLYSENLGISDTVYFRDDLTFYLSEMKPATE